MVKSVLFIVGGIFAFLYLASVIRGLGETKMHGLAVVSALFFYAFSLLP